MVVYTKHGVDYSVPDEGGGSFPFFSSLDELVQLSAIFWMWLHLGSQFFLVMDPDSWRGVWEWEDGLGCDFTWGK